MWFFLIYMLFVFMVNKKKTRKVQLCAGCIASKNKSFSSDHHCSLLLFDTWTETTCNDLLIIIFWVSLTLTIVFSEIKLHKKKAVKRAVGFFFGTLTNRYFVE